MSAHLISILVLVGVFFLGTVRSVNLGVLALVGAFAVGSWVFGAKTSEVLAGFPADLFVILVGVTYLFAIAKRNGVSRPSRCWIRSWQSKRPRTTDTCAAAGS